jgi:hypothetical protein
MLHIYRIALPEPLSSHLRQLIPLWMLSLALLAIMYPNRIPVPGQQEKKLDFVQSQQ